MRSAKFNMLNRTALIIALLFCSIAGDSTADAAADAVQNRAQSDPDLILINARIKTDNGWREAIAIRNGIITSIGDNESIGKQRGLKTEVLNLAGRTVLPGLHDLHVHPLFAGLEQFACRLEPGGSPASISVALRLCAKNAKPGEWITGGNWVSASFNENRQDKFFLDRLIPENPVLLNDEAHHSVWVNSKALQLAGINRNTPDPKSGIIERDKNGEPTGLLRETATRLVENIVPPASADLRRQALILATNQMLSYGITSFTVASVRSADIESLSTLSRAGLLKQRVRGCIVWAPYPESARTMGEELIAHRALYSNDRLKFDCVKLFLDGVPTESHTAAMSTPYLHAQNAAGSGASDSGLLNMDQALLDQVVTRFDRAGLHIKFHAVGDAAVSEAIAAVAKARSINGYGGQSHDVGHASFVNLNDFPKALEARTAWEFSPYIWYPTPIASEDIMTAVGPERMLRWIPIKDALDSGALVVAGSDWSVVPSVNPWLAMETMVTRQKPGGSTETLGEQEKITLDQAFQIFTENGAELMGQRDQVGSIGIGMHADLIVTESNPFEGPVTQVHATKVLRTLIDGKTVFDANRPPKLTAP